MNSVLVLIIILIIFYLTFNISENFSVEESLTNYIESNGFQCFSCHEINSKKIGPAWKDVAAKYKNKEDAVNYLSGKIINGCSGVWGDNVMPAQNVTNQQAETLAKKILQL